MTQALTDILRSWLPRLDPRSDEELGRDLEDEFAFHLDELAREFRDEGMDESAACVEAHRRFGDVEKVRRQCARIARQERVMLQRVNFVLMIIVLLVVAGVGLQVAITQRYNTLALQAITNDLANMKVAADPRTTKGTVYISGDVKRPGAYSLPGTGQLSLTQLIMSSGGLAIGNDATVRLNRGQELDAMTEAFSYSELIASPRTAPAMQAGDAVIVTVIRPERSSGVSQEVLDTDAIVGDWVLTNFGDGGEVKLTIISDDDIRNTSGMKGGEVSFPGIESPVDLRFASHDRTGNLSVSAKSIRFDGRQRKARWNWTEDGELIVNLSECFENDARFTEPLVFKRIAQGAGVNNMAAPPIPREISPFREVRWDDWTPYVLINARWYVPISIDGIAVEKIVEHCRTEHPNNARKRFSEDLIEQLDEMSYTPGMRVALELRPVDDPSEAVRMEVLMTPENRRRTWEVNQEAQDGWLVDYPQFPPDKPQSVLMPEDARSDLEELEERLRNEFSYLTLKGLDHEALFDEARDNLPDPLTIEAFVHHVQKLIVRFGDGHAGVEQFEHAIPRVFLPCLVEDVEGRLVAFKASRDDFVDPDRPYLVAIDGRGVQEWIDAANAYVPDASSQWKRRSAIRELRYLGLLRHDLDIPEKETVALTLVSDSGENQVTKMLPIASSKPIYGDWPRTSSRELNEDVYYLRLRSMGDGAESEIRELIASRDQYKGLIIDVRGNTGGSRDALTLLAPHLLPDSTPALVANIATFRNSEAFDDDAWEVRFLLTDDDPAWSDAARAAIARCANSFTPDWTLPHGVFGPWRYFVIERTPRPAFDDIPVVVLMDSDCFSATDVFLGALAEIPNVTLLGEPSGGGSGATQEIVLPRSRVRLRASTMASFRPNGMRYDGVGVQPDIRVTPSAKYFIGDDDPQQDAALALVKELSRQ